MPLGLGASLAKASIVTPGVVTDSLVMKHMYPTGAVQPVGDGACSFGGAGTGDRVTITEAVFDVDSGTYTFAFWSKRNVIGVDHAILGHTDSKNEGYIRHASDNTIVVESDAAGDAFVLTPHSQDTEWHHYAITISSGTTIVAYQDGVGITLTSGNVNGGNLSINMIGAQNANGADKEMDGYICNVGIWDAILTQPQIKSIMWKQYADLSTSEKTNLVSWWNLDVETNTSGESGTGGVKDHHGSNHGTLS